MSLLLCTIGYALVDYFAYGVIQDDNHDAPYKYRLFQVVCCWLPVMFILDKWDFTAFFLLWWTFILDWLYYFYTIQPYMKKLNKFFGLRPGWDDFDDTRHDFNHGIRHAFFTPVGIWMEVFQDEQKDSLGGRIHPAIPAGTLAFQSIIGVALAILIKVLT